MPTLPAGVALVRTTVPGIDQMVRDWTVMATLMLHRDIPAYLQDAASSTGGPSVRMARECRVGIMGMGRIGRRGAQPFGYRI